MGKLHHYTDVRAVKSILETKELWFTDMRFLNDSEELIGGRKVLRTAHETFKSSLDDRLQEDPWTSLIGNVYDQDAPSVFDRFERYLCSFSRAPDLLSQWRSYGLYCIEFDDEVLGTGFLLEPCWYSESEKALTAETAVARAYNRICRAYEMGDPGACAAECSSAVFSLHASVAWFKHAAFSEEQEVRALTGIGYEPDVYYRVKNDLLIPYVKKPFPFEAIKSVTVGPMKHQDAAWISLNALANQISNREGVDIQVKRSAIPLRTY